MKTKFPSSGLFAEKVFAGFSDDFGHYTFVDGYTSNSLVSGRIDCNART